MHPGGVPTQAPGHSRDHVQSITGDYIDTNVLRVRATIVLFKLIGSQLN